MRNQFAITKEIIEANLKQELNVTALEKLVLICLSNYLGDKNGDGVFTCYPSQSRLAREAGCSRSTVNSALQKLEELSIVRSVYRASEDGGNTSKLYTWIGIPQSSTQETVENVVIDTGASDTATIEHTELNHSVEVVTQVGDRPRHPWQQSWQDAVEESLAEYPPF
ncbi:helix-turn-helix domain-containing protein [Vibrio campbellii]|uniref:helix-turn-helix domain-containing protein n=1 Tax=Vibrio campbellii TaxID=680 RepID=UPI0038571C36